MCLHTLQTLMDAQNWREERSGLKRLWPLKILSRTLPRKKKRSAEQTNLTKRSKFLWYSPEKQLSLSNFQTIRHSRSKLDTDVRKTASWQVEENITEEVLDKKINELVASRGRKNTDPREVLRKLEVLSKSARPLGKEELTWFLHVQRWPYLLISCQAYASSRIADFNILYRRSS